VHGIARPPSKRLPYAHDSRVDKEGVGIRMGEA